MGMLLRSVTLKNGWILCTLDCLTYVRIALYIDQLMSDVAYRSNDLLAEYVGNARFRSYVSWIL